MKSLFSYIAGAFTLIFVVLGALLLFPFFPMLSLCFVMIFIIATAVINSCTDETYEEKGVERQKA